MSAIKKHRFFIISICFAILFSLILPIFNCIAFNKFPFNFSASFRDPLYQFIGFFILPVYTLSGLIIIILLAAMSFKRLKNHKINMLQIICILSSHTCVWLYTANSYILMA